MERRKKDRSKSTVTKPFGKSSKAHKLDELESYIKKTKTSPPMVGSIWDVTKEMIVDKRGLLLFLLDEVVATYSDPAHIQNAAEKLVNIFSSLEPTEFTEVLSDWQQLRFISKKDEQEREKREEKEKDKGEKGSEGGALWEVLLERYLSVMKTSLAPFKKMLKELIQEIFVDIKNTIPDIPTTAFTALPPGMGKEGEKQIEKLPDDLVQRCTNKLVMLLFTFLFSDPSLIPFLFRVICHSIHLHFSAKGEVKKRAILGCLNEYIFAPCFAVLKKEMELPPLVDTVIFGDIPHKIGLLCSRSADESSGQTEENNFINTNSPAALNFAETFCSPEPPSFLAADPPLAHACFSKKKKKKKKKGQEEEEEEGEGDEERPSSPAAETGSPRGAPDPVPDPGAEQGLFAMVDFIMDLQLAVLDALSQPKFASMLTPYEEIYATPAHELATFMMSLKPFDLSLLEAEKKGGQVEGHGSEGKLTGIYQSPITHEHKLQILELLLLEPNFMFCMEKVPRVRYKEGAQRTIDVLIGSQQILPPLANLIKVTVQNSQQGTLMRTDSFCTTLITKYAMSVIEPQTGFLRKLLGPLVREVEALVTNQPFEKDIALFLTEKFTSQILAQPMSVPEPLRILLTILKKEVVKCELGNGRSAVGGMLLLRVVLPCVTMPTLFDSKMEVPHEVKQYLVFISRMLQNLSNGTLPRAEDMQDTHDFLKSKKNDVATYLDSISCVEETILEKAMEGKASKEEGGEPISEVLLRCDKGTGILGEFLMTVKVDIEKYFEKLADFPKIQELFNAIPEKEWTQEKEKGEKKEKKERTKERKTDKDKDSKDRDKEKRRREREKEKEKKEKEKKEREKEKEKEKESKDKEKDSKEKKGSYRKKRFRLSEEFGEEKFGQYVKTLSTLIMNDSHFLYHLDGAIHHNALKKMSDTILDALSLSKYPLLAILRLLETTIEDGEQGTLMRTDSLCTTLLCRYAVYRCEEMKEYLQDVFAPIKGIWDNVTFPLSEETILSMLEKYINCLFTPETDKTIPEEVQVFCTFIRNNVKKFDKGNDLVAVGGYLMLRVFVPCISTPSLYGDDTVIAPELKKNLLLISKLIQCLSNKTLPRGANLAYTHTVLKDRQNDVNKFLDSCSQINDNIISEYYLPECPKEELEHFSELAQGPLSLFFELLYDFKDEWGVYLQNEYVEKKAATQEFLVSLAPPSSPKGKDDTKKGAERKEPGILPSSSFLHKGKETRRDDDSKKKKSRKGTTLSPATTYATPPGSLSPPPGASRKSMRIVPSTTTTDPGGFRLQERDESLPFWKAPLENTIFETEKLNLAHPFFVLINYLESRQADRTYRIFKESGEAANAVCRLVQMAYPKSDFDLSSFSVPSIATAFAKMLQELPNPLISFDAIIAICFLERTDTLRSSEDRLTNYMVTAEILTLFPPSHCTLLMRFFLFLAKIVCNQSVTDVSRDDAVNIVMDIIKPDPTFAPKAKRAILIFLNHVLPPVPTTTAPANPSSNPPVGSSNLTIRKPQGSGMRVKGKGGEPENNSGEGGEAACEEPVVENQWHGSRMRALSRSSSLLHTSGMPGEPTLRRGGGIGGSSLGQERVAAGGGGGLDSAGSDDGDFSDPSSPFYNPLSPPNSSLSPLLSSTSPPISPSASPPASPTASSPPLSPTFGAFRLPQKKNAPK